MTNFHKLLKGLNNVEAAAIAKVKSSQVVEHWRKGNMPKATTLQNFAKHFKTTMESLLKESK